MYYIKNNRRFVFRFSTLHSRRGGREQGKEKPLASLLHKYAPSLPFEQAVMISRLILGGIISYNQYPVLLSDLKEQYKEESLNDYIRRTLTPFILNSIQSYL